MTAPTARARRGPAPLVLALAVGLALLAGLLAAPATATSTTTASAGPAMRVPPTPDADFARLPERCMNADDTIVAAICKVTSFGSTRPTLLVWGDSHALMYLPAVRQLATNRRVNLTYLIHGSCPASVRLPADVDPRVSSCDKSNDRARAYIDQVRHRPAGFTLLIGGFWAGYRLQYRLVQREAAGGAPSGVSDYHAHMARLAVLGTPQLFTWLGRRDLTVDTIAPAATVPASAPACDAGREPYQCDLPRADAFDREHDNLRWLRQRMRALSRPSIMVDAGPGYCSATTCFAHVGGVDTWYDDVHLGAALAGRLGPYFRPVFDQIRATRR